MAEKPSGTTALQWVERLLEPSASEDTMIEAAQVFSPGHYSDVVDERIISHLCGYPPCSNHLGPQPRQKYHISLAQKKVFDLTQRKKFCSVECYRASNYYASQLSSLPPPAIIGTAVVIKFLPHSGSKAEHFKTSDVVKPPPMTSPADDLGVVIKEVPMKETTSKLSELRVTDEGEDAESGDSEPKDSVHLAHPKLSSVGRLLHAMSSWCTPDTRCFVEQVRQQTHLERDPVQTPERDSGKVYAPCVVEGSKRSCDEEACQESEEGEVEETREDLDGATVLPPVHSSAQSQLQRTIFVQQLRRNVSSVAADLSLDTYEVLPRILQLVWTFRLSRYTVMFKPAEWKVIILILIHIAAPECNTVTSKQTSGIIQQWLRAVDATNADMNLMMDTFNH